MDNAQVLRTNKISHLFADCWSYVQFSISENKVVRLQEKKLKY